MIFRNSTTCKGTLYVEKTFSRWFRRQVDWAGLNVAAIRAVVPADHESVLAFDPSYTSRGYELRFFEELEPQGQQGVQRSLMGGVGLAQAVHDRRFERSEVGVVVGIQALLFDELPEPFDQVEIG